MNRILRCPNGHKWADTLLLNDGGTVDLTSACPTCGSQGKADGEMLTEDSSVSAQSATGNLQSAPNHMDLATLATDDNIAPVASDHTVPLDSAHPIDEGQATLADNSASAVSQDPSTLPLSSSEERELDQTQASENDGDQSASTRLLEVPPRDGDHTVDQTQATAPPRPTDIGQNPGAATAKRAAVGPTKAPGRFKKDSKLPDKVAGYEILGLLGRGGMGVVYKARQAGLNRLCALKMIIGGGHASQDAVARFKIEAKAIAHLQHPNIVQVYEIGEDNGSPYFSLEFVDGTTLQNKISSTPQPPAETARLMKQICDGVHAAHLRGVLHRDLKPANVLLTHDNIPKITDFGLAKRLEEEDHGQTRTGAIMGTPSYMAPEQAMGRAKELGPPADIYSLGAILYDMLTGRPPFRGETVMDTLNQVQTLEPMPPEKLVPKVPRDLQTICLKALNKEAKKRYATAGDMAEDLRRYLANEPIMARPTPLWERCVKWAKRRPATATLISVSTVAFITVLTLGVLWLDSARAAAEDREAYQTEQTKLEKKNSELQSKRREEAEQAKKEADRLRAEAEASFNDANAAVEEMLTRVGLVNLEYEPRMENVRNQLVEKALEFNLKFLKQRGPDPVVLNHVAKAYENVGKIKRMLGNYEEAAQNYDAALDRYRELAKKPENALEYRNKSAACIRELAFVRQLQHRHDDSEKGYLLALEEFDSLRTLQPNNPEYQKELANLETSLGNLCMVQERFQEAEMHYDTALNLRNAMLAAGIDDVTAQQGLASLQINRGVLLFHLGKKKEAVKSLSAARDTFEKLSKKAPEVPDYPTDWGIACINLGISYRKAGDEGLSEGAFEDAIEILNKLRGKFPSTPIYGQKLAHALSEYGILLATTDHRPQAVEQLTKAIDLLVPLHNAQPKVTAIRLQLAKAHTTLGIVLVQSAKVDDGLKQYKLAEQLLEAAKPAAKTEPEFCTELAEVHDNIAKLLVSEAFSKPLEAEKNWDRMFSLHEELVAAYPKSTGYRLTLAERHSEFAKRFLSAGKPEEAAKHATLAVASIKEAVALLPNNNAIQEMLFRADIGLAKAQLANQKHVDAATAANDADAVFAADSPKNGPRKVRIAEVYGQCMVVAEADKGLSGDRRQALLAEYGDKALLAIRSAVNAGYNDVNHVKTAPEFRLLRERDDIQALLKELEGKAKAK